MTTPSLSAFLTHRRVDLLKKIDDCRIELAELEKELSEIETAGFALNLSFEDKDSAGSSSMDRIRAFVAHNNSKKNPDMTMKEAALEILKECTGGMTTNDILEVLNEKLRTSYPRSSLSPQLSRLKGDGKIYRESGRWMLSIA